MYAGCLSSKYNNAFIVQAIWIYFLNISYSKNSSVSDLQDLKVLIWENIFIEIAETARNIYLVMQILFLAWPVL